MKNDDIIHNLKSANPEIVIQSIEELRETGTPALFYVLLELLKETTNDQIKKNILELFSEIKSTATVPLLMNAIQDIEYKPELKELVSCCWQNGMNYSGYLPIFVDLVINSDFEVAFESFTVIENLYGKIDKNILDQEISKINLAIPNADDQRRYLLSLLPSIIENIPEEQEFEE